MIFQENRFFALPEILFFVLQKQKNADYDTIFIKKFIKTKLLINL